MCPKALISRLPSRILDLEPFGGTSDLRLCVDVKSYGRYATLSHCWGKSQPLKLMRATYNEFQNEIAYDSLPKTFQDGVTATRLLGLRYLWIDSLCIIQDSSHDWEEQCTEMKRIYKDSFVTLAGAAASGCESGFLHARPASYDATVQLADSGSSCQVILSHSGIDKNPSYPSPEPNSPLMTRAWVLQERLLSARVLYFGTKKMYLECFTNVQLDDCHYPIKWNYGEVGMVVKSAIDQLGNLTKCFRYWTTLVMTYSRLDLTNITDRLPALSGLASDFHSTTGARYLAGLWREDMPRALTWQVTDYEKAAAVSSSDSPSYIAPSWSWAATKFGVWFVDSNHEHEFSSDLDIIATEAPTGRDPFGMVKGGFIEASGRIQRGLIKAPRGYEGSKSRRLYFQDSSILVSYTLDDSNKAESHEPGVWLLYLGIFSGYTVVAMAVKLVDGGCNTYERVGLVTSDAPVRGSDQVFGGIFQDVAKTRIRLI